MAPTRASKGFLQTPVTKSNITSEAREKWLSSARSAFVQPSEANKIIYAILLESLWPDKHGIPGPVLSQDEIRAVVDAARAKLGQPTYKDVFRRLRELQGEEGFTCIVKEGVKYQLQSMVVGIKRQPREKPDDQAWKDLKAKFRYRCAVCGLQEPDVKLSPDHRVPRSRQGGNESSNWQPLCEQCNNVKSSACRGCKLNCFTCPWAYPETYMAIKIDDENRTLLARDATKKGINQDQLANNIIRTFFQGKKKN